MMKRPRTIALLLLGLYAGLIVLSLWFAAVKLDAYPWNIATQSRLDYARTHLDFEDWNGVVLLKDWIGLLFWVGGLLNLCLIFLLALTTRWWLRWSGPHPDIASNSQEALVVGEEKACCCGFRKHCGPLWLWGVAFASMVAAVWFTYPRLGQSLWGDEDYTLRLHMHGNYTRNYEVPGYEEDGLPMFRELSWREAIFGYRTTNNHFLYTILAKGTLKAWQAATGREVWSFDEKVLRFWPFLFGVLGIGAWIWLLRRLALTKVALALALILPFHPWYGRYLAEARGYAFLFLLLPLLLLALLAAINTGKWRYWFSYGICQVLVLYSWPATVVQVAGINLLALALVFFPWLTASLGDARKTLAQPRTLVSWRTNLIRWGLVCLLGAFLIFQFVSPGVPQVRKYLLEDALSLPVWYEDYDEDNIDILDFDTGPTNQPWLKDVGALMAIGTDWVDVYGNGRANPHFITVARLKRHGTKSLDLADPASKWFPDGRTPAPVTPAPSGVWLAVGEVLKPIHDLVLPHAERYLLFFYVFVVLGLIYFAWQARAGTLMVGLAVLLPSWIFFYYLGYYREKYLFKWYFVYLLPFLLAFAASGVLWTFGSLGELLGRRLGKRIAEGIGLALLVGSVFVFSYPKLMLMQHRSLNPLRESVDQTRPGFDYRNPAHPENWSVLTAHVFMGAFSYDPFAYPIDTAFKPTDTNLKSNPSLTRLMRMADEGDVPLFVNVGYPEEASKTLPRIMKIIRDPELFEPLDKIWGQEYQHSREVYRYKGGFFSALAPRRTPKSPSETEETGESQD